MVGSHRKPWDIWYFCGDTHIAPTPLNKWALPKNVKVAIIFTAFIFLLLANLSGRYLLKSLYFCTIYRSLLQSRESFAFILEGGADWHYFEGNEKEMWFSQKLIFLFISRVLTTLTFSASWWLHDTAWWDRTYVESNNKLYEHSLYLVGKPLQRTELLAFAFVSISIAVM